MKDDDFKEILEKEIKEKELENDKANARNRSGNSEQIIGENEKRWDRENSESFTESNGRQYGGYTPMASLRFSDSLLRTKFTGRITEGIDRNSDEPRNESKSRLSGAESRESRAESRESGAESRESRANLSTSKIIYGKNEEKIRGKLNLEEKEEYQKISSSYVNHYIDNEGIKKDLECLKKDLKYLNKKENILTQEAKEKIKKRINNNYTKLINYGKINKISKNLLNVYLNEKELKICENINNKSKERK